MRVSDCCLASLRDETDPVIISKPAVVLIYYRSENCGLLHPLLLCIDECDAARRKVGGKKLMIVVVAL